MCVILYKRNRLSRDIEKRPKTDYADKKRARLTWGVSVAGD